jgi:hypothetical protein
MINNIRTCNVEPTICPVPKTFSITYKATTPSQFNNQETSIIQNPDDDIQTIIKQSEYFSYGADIPDSDIYIKVGNDITDSAIRENSQLVITTTREYTKNGAIVNHAYRLPEVITKTHSVKETENDYKITLGYGMSSKENIVSYSTPDKDLNINKVQYGTYLEYLKLQFELKVNNVIQPNTGFTKIYNLEHRVKNQIKTFKWGHSQQDGLTVSDSSMDSKKDILKLDDPTITELIIIISVGVYTTQGPGVSITSTTEGLKFNGLEDPSISYDGGKSNIYNFKQITVSGFNGLTGNHVIKLASTGGPEKTITLIKN